MANTLSIYDPLFYANEALIWLKKALGMAGRVHRDFSPDPQQKGSTIQVRRPSSFTAQDAPSVPQDINASMVPVVLNKWKEVKFKLTDKELTFTKEKIIQEHIQPAAYALADDLDQNLASQIKQFYTQVSQAGGTMALVDVAAAAKSLFTNKVPMQDQSMLHMMIDGTAQADLQVLLAPFTMTGNDQTALRSGTIGRLSGLEVFANQNTPTVNGSSPFSAGAVTVNGVQAINAGSTDFGKTGTVSLAKITNPHNLLEGDIITIAGDTQQYVVTANTTLIVGNTTVPIAPALQKATVGAEVVTLVAGGVLNCAFHRNAITLATAPLSTIGAELGGTRLEVVNDETSGISLRSRVYYMPDASEVRVALDILYGYTMLDRALGMRLKR